MEQVYIKINSVERSLSLIQLSQLKTIRVKVTGDTEITSDFMQLFSRYVINSNYFNPIQHYQNNVINYHDFYDALKKIHSKYRQSSRLIQIIQDQCQYIFEADNNNVILILDLSPYMLLYDYSTKSFPLRNMEEIIKNIVKCLQARKLRNPLGKLILSVYGFSTNYPQFHRILRKHEIKQSNYNQIIRFLLRYVQRSKLPHFKSDEKNSISSMIQKIIEDLQLDQGFQSIITVSLFHDEQANPIIFFGTDWFNYGFISTGRNNMGTYLIDPEHISNCFTTCKYFHTKFVFSCQFLENWQMLQLYDTHPNIQQKQTSRDRQIIYNCQNHIYEDVFQVLLSFRFSLPQRQRQISKISNSVKSVYKQQNRNVTLKQYRISQQNLSTIMRIRYQQGWEPVITNSMNIYPDNTKFVFRLIINDSRTLYYDASRAKGYFNIKIYQNGTNAFSDKGYLDQIQMIDVLNSVVFDISQISRDQNKKQKTSLSRYPLITYEQSQIIKQIKMLNYVRCLKGQQWSRFLKVRRVYIQFQPKLTENSFNEFLAEIMYLLGSRVTKTFFVQTKQYGVEIDNPLNRRSKMVKTKFTKLKCYGSMLQLLIGYIKYSKEDVKKITNNIKNKINSIKFKKGSITVISQELYTYAIKKSLQTFQPFKQLWTIRFQYSRLYSIFKIYLVKLFLKNNFILIQENEQNETKYYYKMVELHEQNDVDKNFPFTKAIICKIHYKQSQRILQIQCLTLPLLGKILSEKIVGGISKMITISFSEYFLRLCQRFKIQQQKLYKMVMFYQYIHQKLLREKKYANILQISSEFKTQIMEIYRFTDFRYQYEDYCKQILIDLYSQSKYFEPSLRDIPKPTKLLINADIDDIKGEVQMQDKQIKYAFFLFSPYTPVYVLRQGNTFYYKFINVIYGSSIQQNNDRFKSLVIQELRRKIQQSEYLKNYSLFFNQKIEHFTIKYQQQKTINLSNLFKINITEPYITNRVLNVLNKFEQVYKNILEILFFQKGQYYREKQNSKKILPSWLQKEKINTFHQIIMKDKLYIDGQQTKMEGLKNCIKKGNDHPKVELVLTYCAKSIDAEIKYQKMEYLFYLVEELISQCIWEVQRLSLYKTWQFQSILQKLKLFTKGPVLKYKELRHQRVQIISKQIEFGMAHNVIPMKKMTDDCKRFINCVQDNKYLLIPAWIILQMSQQCIKSYYVNYKILHEDKLEDMDNKIQRYFLNLTNNLHLNRLINQLIETHSLPKELYLNQYAHKPSNNRKVEIKRKLNKASYPNKFKKIIPVKEVNEDLSNQFKYTYPLPLLYKGIFPLPSQFKENTALEAIQVYQSFQIGQIQNLINTYFFMNVNKKDDVYVLHFQEALQNGKAKQLFQKKETQGDQKTQNALIYFVHCLNIKTPKQEVQELIRPLIREAINAKLFLTYSSQLTKYSQVLSEQQQRFFKQGENKIFKFKIPFVELKRNLRGYIKQHILIYHNQTHFKNQDLLRKQHPQRCHEHMWLFNFQKNKLLGATFGSCMYLLKIKITNSIDNNQKFCEIQRKKGTDKRKYLYPLTEDQQKKQNYLAQFFKKKNKISKCNIVQVAEPYTQVHFQIIYIIGMPILNSIQEAFRQILMFGLQDYYIENQLFECIRLPNNQQSISQTTLKSQSQIVVGKKKQKIRDKNIMKFVNIAKIVQQQIPKVNSVSFFSIISQSKLYVKDVKIYFQDFLNVLDKLLKSNHVYKMNDIPIIFYGEEESGKIRYLVAKNTNVSLSKEFVRIGFIMSEYFLETNQLIQRQRYCENQEFQFLKQFKDDKPFCEKQYYFRRSIFINFQLSYTRFFFNSYNLNWKINLKIKQYLGNLQAWLTQKARLLTFMTNTKYGIYKKPQLQNIGDYLNIGLSHRYFIQTNQTNDSREIKEQATNKRLLRQKNLTNLVKSLVKDNFPPKWGFQSLDVNPLYDQLIKHTIDYTKYPQYKGKQQSQLERMGKQYLSIIRHKYHEQSTQRILN